MFWRPVLYSCCVSCHRGTSPVRTFPHCSWNGSPNGVLPANSKFGYGYSPKRIPKDQKGQPQMSPGAHKKQNQPQSPKNQPETTTRSQKTQTDKIQPNGQNPPTDGHELAPKRKRTNMDSNLESPEGSAPIPMRTRKEARQSDENPLPAMRTQTQGMEMTSEGPKVPIPKNPTRNSNNNNNNNNNRQQPTAFLSPVSHRKTTVQSRQHSDRTASS